MQLIHAICAGLKVKCTGNSLPNVKSDINFNKNREKYFFRNIVFF